MEMMQQDLFILQTQITLYIILIAKNLELIIFVTILAKPVKQQTSKQFAVKKKKKLHVK